MVDFPGICIGIAADVHPRSGGVIFVALNKRHYELMQAALHKWAEYCMSEPCAVERDWPLS